VFGLHWSGIIPLSGEQYVLHTNPSTLNPKIKSVFAPHRIVFAKFAAFMMAITILLAVWPAMTTTTMTGPIT
jgi:hypothetical protein